MKMNLIGAVIAAGFAMTMWAREEVVLEASAADLSRDNGLVVRDGQPFNGVVLETATDGRVIGRSEYRDGREHGTAYRWFANGQLESERHYQSGVKSGSHVGYWANGSRRFIESFAGGVYHGELRGWYENGQLAEVRNFDHGVETGRQRSWDAKGAVMANYVVRDGRRFGLIGARPCFLVTGEHS